MKKHDWDDFKKFERADDTYLPEQGQGTTMATQIVTAVTKLVYKWFNDGDVFDNTYYMSGFENDVSSYANWLYKYTDAGEILDRIKEVMYEWEYTELMWGLCEKLLDLEDLESWNKKSAEGSVYKCDGPFEFEEYNEDEDYY